MDSRYARIVVHVVMNNGFCLLFMRAFDASLFYRSSFECSMFSWIFLSSTVRARNIWKWLEIFFFWVKLKSYWNIIGTLSKFTTFYTGTHPYPIMIISQYLSWISRWIYDVNVINEDVVFLITIVDDVWCVTHEPYWRNLCYFINCVCVDFCTSHSEKKKKKRKKQTFTYAKK